MQCKTCDHEAMHGYKFCSKCKKTQLRILESSGYLTPRIKIGNNRTAEMKEDQRETRKGVDR